MLARSRNCVTKIALPAVLVFILAVSAVVPVTASSQADLGNALRREGVILLGSDAQGISLELNTPAYQSAEATAASIACRNISVSDYVQSEDPGRPQLPVKVVLLGVPPGAELALDTFTVQTTRTADALPICPAAPSGVERDETGEVRQVAHAAVADPAVYAADRFYPAAPVRLVDLGLMRSQRIVRLEITPFQVNPVTGELLHHQQVRVSVRFRGAAQNTGNTVAEPSDFEAAFQQTLLNYDSARAWRVAEASAATPTAWTPPQPAYKIMVKAAGLYELTPAALAAAGLPAAGLDPRTLRLFNGGQEVALRVLGEGDGKLDSSDRVLFYAQGANTRYTDTNVYWLTYGGAPGLRMADRSGGSGGVQPAPFQATVDYEQNLTYVSSLPMKEGYDHWYGERLQAAGGNPTGRNFNLAISKLASGTASATLEVQLAGNVEGTHHLRLKVNNQLVRDASWTGRTIYRKLVAFPQGHLVEGTNVIRVELVNDTAGQPLDMVYVDWLKLGYPRQYEASGDSLAFGGDQAGTWRYRVSGFTDPAVEVYDVTDPLRVTRIADASTATGGKIFLPVIVRSQNTASSQAAGAASFAAATYAVRFSDNQAAPRRYLALTPGQRKAPIKIEADVPSNLQTPGSGADYIIITHAAFRDAVQPLAAQRAAQGMRVQVVDVQDVYDEFGYGLMSAEAIHDFLAYAYAAWPQPAPSHVLLVGDGTYDFRPYLSTSGSTYIPPYLALVDPDIGETIADNRFVTVAGSDILPDMHIGRLPANTAAEATIMVNKTLSYENTPVSGNWNRNMLFMTDDLAQGGGDFYALSDGIADGYADPPADTTKLIPDLYARTKVYLDKTCPLQNPSVACRQQIIDAINAGTLFVSYIGHGTKTYWAGEKLLDQAGLAQLTNSSKLTIMLPMTCDNGYFAQPELNAESFGESSVRMTAGGAVATWSPTGFGLATGHDYLERGIFLAMFHGGPQRLGAAATWAKLYLAANAPPNRYADLIDTFVLLGDTGLQPQFASQ